MHMIIEAPTVLARECLPKIEGVCATRLATWEV